MRRLAVVLASGALALGAACASLSGLTGGDGTQAAPAEAGTESGPAESGPPPPTDPCSHATLPPPPVVDDDPNGAVPTLVVAVRDESVTGTVDAGAPIGFDLDGVCTCFSDTTTAHGASPSCTVPDGGSPACDGDGGVDRQISALLAAYTVPSGSGASAGPTFLLKVTKYNGRANDREVFVGLIPSPGIYDATGCVMDAGDGVPPYRPTWQGCDKFALDQSAVLPTTNEPLVYLPAYVTDHVLVVPRADKPVSFVVGSATLVVSGAVMSIHLTAVDESMQPIVPPPDVGHLFHFDGTVGGRVGTADALLAIANEQAVNDGGPLCGFPNFFDTIKRSFVCPGADIAASPADDFKGAACDALSVAAAFTADPVQLGSSRKQPPLPCADPTDPQYAAFFDCAK